jgi:hypothetical protein
MALHKLTADFQDTFKQTFESTTLSEVTKRLGISRPRTAYSYYMAEQRKVNEGLTLGELSKIIGPQWKNLDEEERREYKLMEEDDFKRYEQELKTAIEELDGAPLPDLPASKPKRKPKRMTVAKRLGVKNAMTSYIFFSKEMHPKLRQKYPDLKMTDIIRKLSEQWKALTPNKREKYNKLAAKDKERYDREIAEKLEDNPNAREEVRVQNATIMGKKVHRKRNTYGVKNARSAYIFFSNNIRSVIRSENPELSMTEVSKIIGARWNELDEEGRLPYKEQASVDKERFIREFTAAKEAAEQAAQNEREDEPGQTENNNEEQEAPKRRVRRRRVAGNN